jgi:hypothetical protein
MSAKAKFISSETALKAESEFFIQLFFPAIGRFPVICRFV